MKTKEKVEQGKGTADHLMPLGYLLKVALAWGGRGPAGSNWVIVCAGWGKTLALV